jgi:hypothetical protein
MPWGAPRYASASLPTRSTFTGQYSYTDDLATPTVIEGSAGLANGGDGGDLYREILQEKTCTINYT